MEAKGLVLPVCICNSSADLSLLLCGSQAFNFTSLQVGVTVCYDVLQIVVETRLSFNFGFCLANVGSFSPFGRIGVV